MTDAPFNVIASPSCMVRFRSGAIRLIPLHEITATPAEDPVVEVCWPRPDFRVAQMELLIGIVALALAPANHSEWLDRWYDPPTPQELQQLLAPLVPHFNLDGPGPRFMQDFDGFEAEAIDATDLLTDAPGQNGVKLNIDLFVKRGTARFSRAAAAIALAAYHSNAGSGGAGYFTAWRGGGPLTTLMVPVHREGRSLWRTVWANVLTQKGLPSNDVAAPLPWTRPYRLNGPFDQQEATFGMPRRVRLNFEPGNAARCSITGLADTVMVRTMQKTNKGGTQYSGKVPAHPLSPYYAVEDKTGKEWLPVHASGTRLGYGQMIGLLAETEGRRPAEVVRVFRGDRFKDVASTLTGHSLWAAGFDLDKSRVDGYLDGQTPVHTLVDAAANTRLDQFTNDMAKAGKQVCSLTARLIANAQVSHHAMPKTASDTLRRRAMLAVEEGSGAAFADRVADLYHALRRDPDTDLAPTIERYWSELRRAAMRVFDTMVPLDLRTASLHRVNRKLGPAEAAPPVFWAVSARRRLHSILYYGGGPEGDELFKLLNLTKPEATDAHQEDEIQEDA